MTGKLKNEADEVLNKDAKLNSKLVRWELENELGGCGCTLAL